MQSNAVKVMQKQTQTTMVYLVGPVTVRLTSSCMYRFLQYITQKKMPLLNAKCTLIYNCHAMYSVFINQLGLPPLQVVIKSDIHSVQVGYNADHHHLPDILSKTSFRHLPNFMLLSSNCGLWTSAKALTTHKKWKNLLDYLVTQWFIHSVPDFHYRLGRQTHF